MYSRPHNRIQEEDERGITDKRDRKAGRRQVLVKVIIATVMENTVTDVSKSEGCKMRGRHLASAGRLRGDSAGLTHLHSRRPGQAVPVCHTADV